MAAWQGEADRTGSVEQAWARVRANLRESAGVRLFDQWLKPMQLLDGSDADGIRLALPTAFATNWVRNHYADRLLREFRAVLPGVQSVSIETCAAVPRPIVLTATPVAPPAAPSAAPTRQGGSPAPVLPPVAAAQPLLPLEAPPAPVPAPASLPASAESPAAPRPALDPRLTFDRFVVDQSNRVALNAARALAEPGAPRFSPLFLHSGTGQGKTHLMHALGHAFLAHRPNALVIYMSAERFMFEFVSAMRARDTHAFKSRLRAADLLLIDDLQFIAGKDATQEEFFHTINEVIGAGKRLVIAADRCPQALDGVEPRIVSRLGGGLVADIKAPERTLRRAILDSRLAELPDVAVPEEVLELLATRVHANIRELEGALNRVVAYAQLTGDRIDLEFAVATLGDVLRGAERRVTIDEIQKAVSAHFELKPVDLVSARRARAIARPRQIAMYLAKQLTTRSLPEIGRKFGGRDHSTVIHAVRRIEELRGHDHDVDGAVRVLMRQLEA